MRSEPRRVSAPLPGSAIHRALERLEWSGVTAAPSFRSGVPHGVEVARQLLANCCMEERQERRFMQEAIDLARVGTAKKTTKSHRQPSANEHLGLGLWRGRFQRLSARASGAEPAVDPDAISWTSRR